MDLAIKDVAAFSNHGSVQFTQQYTIVVFHEEIGAFRIPKDYRTLSE
jgi:hypothetical protein